MKTIEVKGVEFPNADEAIQHWYASGRGEVILVGGKLLVVEKDEARRLESAGVAFAYIHEHEMPDGSFRIVTVPVN